MPKEDSIGRTGKHSQFCEGHVSCPKTGKEECCKVVVQGMYSFKGSALEVAMTVLCFGCGETHNVGANKNLSFDVVLKRLQEQAKPLSELMWENAIEFREWQVNGITSGQVKKLNPKFQGKWVSVDVAATILRTFFDKELSLRKTMKIANIFGNIDHWFECNGILHIGTTTGKSGHWIAHPLCGKRLRKWVGFGELQYAKTDEVCGLCFLLHVGKQVFGESFWEKRLFGSVQKEGLNKK